MDTNKLPKLVQVRAEWGGKIEFFLTIVGYAVGLGNIWRFPYLCYKNGGGAFLIPYFLMLFLVGLPLFFMELSFGQFASLGPLAIWNINPFFKGLGCCAVSLNLVQHLYYNVIVAWSLYFLFASMTSELPWTTCNNLWNTPYCVDDQYLKNSTIMNGSIFLNNEYIHLTNTTTPSAEYFYRKVLQMSSTIEDFGTIIWQLALCLFLAWLIVFVVLIKGISSLGKVVYFSTIFPYVLLTAILIRGVTLDGAYEGILYYLKPDWSRLIDASVWSDAATQIFFSLSTCTGGLISMASYNKFNNNCLRDGILVPLINCATSFYGGFAIFSVLGYMAKQKGVSVGNVAASGPGLVFVVYPEGLSNMPIAPLWSILFFLMMLTLGFSTMFSMVESFFCAFMDQFPYILNKNKLRSVQTRIFFITLFYVFGLIMCTNGGFYFFSLMDGALSSFPLLVIGFFECIVLIHIYGIRNFCYDVEMMLGKKPNLYYKIMWLVITPLVLLATILFLIVQYKPLTLFSGKYIYPKWGDGITWAIISFSLVSLPIFALIRFFHFGGFQVLKQINRPTDEWKPALNENCTGRYDKTFDNQIIVNSYNL